MHMAVFGNDSHAAVCTREVVFQITSCFNLSQCPIFKEDIPPFEVQRQCVTGRERFIYPNKG